MVVYSGGFQWHFSDLDRYLADIQKSRITLKLRKCQLAHPKVKFCSKIIGYGKRKVDPDKMAAVETNSSSTIS